MAPGLSAALQTLGARRVEAALVEALAARGEMETRQILEATGLRQPEVSMGMQRLRERGWVEAHQVPREGKGRPMHRYALAVPRSRLRRHYQDAGRKKIASVRAALDAVRTHLP